MQEAIHFLYFGAAGMPDFTHHKDEQQKQQYSSRQKKNKIWSKSGKPTIKDSYMDIKAVSTYSYMNMYIK
jgi:hypothetical protein